MTSPDQGAPAKEVKRKRVVTTAADREKARLKAEDMRWKAARTPEAKAWINSTRLLKEFLTSGDDVLTLKVAAATRRDILTKGEAMGLYVEMFDTRPHPDASLESWIVLGRPSARMSIAGKVREIQRQSKRQQQEAAEVGNDVDAGDGASADAAVEPFHTEQIDPSLREHRAPMAQMLPGIQEWNDQPNGSGQELPPIGQILEATATHGASNLNNGTATYSRQPRAVIARPRFMPERANNDFSDLLPGEILEPADQQQHTNVQQEEASRGQEANGIQGQPPASEDNTGSERIASWVDQQAQKAQQEKDLVDPTGKWRITCPAIVEQIGSSEHKDLSLTIYIDKTRPQSDNDTDDGNDDTDKIADGFQHNLDDTDVSEENLTAAQKLRLGSYQMWATFELGLYQGIIRFMAPTVRSGNQTRRSDFDLQPDRLPSLSNRTFQYKWRGREATDSEISVEAEQATQWIKFEEDGVSLSGVFESEYLGETAFEGSKTGHNGPARLHLGRLWSEVSPKAHEYEAQQKQ